MISAGSASRQEGRASRAARRDGRSLRERRAGTREEARDALPGAPLVVNLLLPAPVIPRAIADATPGRLPEDDAPPRPGDATGAINYYRAACRSETRIPGQRRSLEKVPTLVLWGEGDRYLGTELLDGLDAFVPDLRLVRIPFASHWLPADAADVVNVELVAFFGT